MTELFLGVVLSVPTRACLIDADGCIRGHGLCGRNTLWDYEGAVKSVAEVAAEALSSAGLSLPEVRMTCVTFDGLGQEDDFFWANGLVRRALGDAPFITSDHVSAAHAAAHGSADGIVVVASDESQALGAKGGRWARAGGWGGVFGGEGTIYRIMTRGLRAAARYADGRGDETRLLGDYCCLLDCWPGALTYRIHDKHISYRDLCEVVFRCAEAGDPLASMIVREESRELVSMAKAVATRLEMPNPRISVIGQCFDFRVFVDAFRRHAKKQLLNSSVELCDRPTVEGAAIMAKMYALGAKDS